MTSAHPQEDVRIFHKECVSLAKAGYEVYLVSHGSSYEKKGVHLVGIGEPKRSRLERMTQSAKAVYEAARAIDADIYHLHDPELLPYGLKLKKAGKKVLFDSHEDVPATIVDKPYLPGFCRKPISVLYKAYETHAAKKLDAVVTATPHIAELFEGRCGRVAAVNNYPKLDDIVFQKKPFREREPVACYAGGVDETRGELLMIEAMKGVDGQLIIAGDHEIAEIDGKVKYIGRIDRKGVNELYSKAVAGICILKPLENYYYSKPVKVYEYMAAGLPYICSDFPDWREVAEKSGAGICVDPADVGAIRDAIVTLLTDRDRAQAMGLKGREYVVKNCNWDNEERTLLSLYKAIGG